MAKEWYEKRLTMLLLMYCKDGKIIPILHPLFLTVYCYPTIRYPYEKIGDRKVNNYGILSKLLSHLTDNG
nr:MetaGeneMark_Unknown Function [uncultured bacterium]